MPRKPIIDDVDRDNLDELVSYYEEIEKPASLPPERVQHWIECESAGLVMIDRDKGTLQPTTLGITYIRRSRGHRGRGHNHATET